MQHKQPEGIPDPLSNLTQSPAIMKGTCLLVLLLKYVHQSNCCELAEHTLFCTTIPSEFPSGLSTLLILVSQDIGEVNGTVFHHDNLGSVTSFNIKRAGITGIAEGAFNSFLGLKSLALDQNQLTDINHRWFSRPATLTELSMSENHLEVLNKGMVEGFANLNKLDLRWNQISFIEPQTFRELPGLAFLDLSDNNLTQVTSEMFSPLHNTSLSLKGNPWRCTCDAQDFYTFIMDLRNRSLLLHAEDVTCASPPSLRGKPVWNVSECSTPYPAPTNAALTTTEDPNVSRPVSRPVSSPMADTTTTLHLKTTSPTSSSLIVPNHGFTGSHRPPPYTTNIVPMLSTVIVALCVALLLVIILALVYRRKRCRKTVAPRDQSKQTTTETDHQKDDVTGHTCWDIEAPSPMSLTGVRAKSANAILFTSPFASAGFHDPASLGDGENKTGAEEEIHGVTAELSNNLCDSLSVTHVQHETTPVTCEHVPYLSIGSQAKQSDNNTPLDMKSPLEMLGKRMHRISTWPPTAVQWQDRCKREKEQGEIDCAVNVWGKMEDKVLGDLDKTANLSIHYEQDDEELREKVTGSTRRPEGETRLEKDMAEMGRLDDAASSTISDSNDLSVRRSMTNAETSENEDGLKDLHMVKAEAACSGGAGSRRGESRASDSGSEYVFVDLLHEVVQNRGRWTRDRWRHIRSSRQRTEQHEHR